MCVCACIRWCRSPYQQRIPLIKEGITVLWSFLSCWPEQGVEKNSLEAWIWDAMTLIWRHCNAISKCTTNFWAKLSFQCQSDDKKLHQPSKLAFSERPVCFTCALSIVFEHKINFCVDIVRVVCFSCVWLSCICLSFMMTSSNGNIFRVTGHLCGEFTGPLTKASDAEFWCFLLSASE